MHSFRIDRTLTLILNQYYESNNKVFFGSGCYDPVRL